MPPILGVSNFMQIYGNFEGVPLEQCMKFGLVIQRPLSWAPIHLDMKTKIFLTIESLIKKAWWSPTLLKINIMEPENVLLLHCWKRRFKSNFMFPCVSMTNMSSICSQFRKCISIPRPIHLGILPGSFTGFQERYRGMYHGDSRWLGGHMVRYTLIGRYAAR